MHFCCFFFSFYDKERWREQDAISHVSYLFVFNVKNGQKGQPNDRVSGYHETLVLTMSTC